MIQENAGGVAAETPEHRFDAPLQLWEIFFLIAFTFGIFAGFCIQSSKEYFVNDELITALVVSNPSFSEMWHLIRHGGELNPPLFFIIEWVVARLVGPSEFALRFVSAAAISFGGGALFFTIRSLTGPRIAALAIAFVFGLSRDVFIFATTARYYGLLLGIVCLAIYWAVRLSRNRPLTRKDYLAVFLVHCVLVYTHLYGGLYSGMIFGAMLISDCLRGKIRWPLFASIIAAWVAFAAWLPAMREQLKSVSGGIYVPPGYLKLGIFIEEIGLQTPMALIAFFVVILGCIALMVSRPCAASDEATRSYAPIGWTTALLVGIAIMCVPVGTWLASHFLNPPPYMRRYIFPCIGAWAIFWAAILSGIFRLSPAKPVFKFKVPPILWTFAWVVVLMFCVGFQPLRSYKNPPRAAAPFVDLDYGHKDLPIVFENSWYSIQRAFYGKGREYALLIDEAAGNADPSWYTKGMYRFFRGWYPRYHDTRIMRVDDLPAEFIAVDDDYTKTFEWVFEHNPGLTRELLGKHQADNEIHGEERIWLVHNASAKKK